MNEIEIIEGVVEFTPIDEPPFAFEGAKMFVYYKVSSRVSNGQEKLDRLNEPCNFVFPSKDRTKRFKLPILYGKLDVVDEGEVLNLVVGFDGNYNEA